MLASNGDMTPPWGVPASVACQFPLSITPAFSHARICLRIGDMVFSFSSNALWSILSKHFAMSASNTHLGLYLMLKNIASIASWHPLPGLNP